MRTLAAIFALAAAAPAVALPSATLFAAVEEHFPKSDCAEPFPLRSCFDIDQPACEARYLRALKGCEVELAPRMLNGKDCHDAGVAGMLLGQCALVKYISGLPRRAPYSNDCRAALSGARVWSPEEVARYNKKSRAFEAAKRPAPAAPAKTTHRSAADVLAGAVRRLKAIFSPR